MKHFYPIAYRSLFLLICIFTSLSSWADDYTKDGIIYSIDDANSTASVKGVENRNIITTATIKEDILGCKVTSIQDNAFINCENLESISIPSSVTSIGEYAIFNCNSLKSISIPPSVTEIKSGAFINCASLTSVEFNPKSSLTSIGDYAFCRCTSLISFKVPSSVKNIGEAAFAGCNSLTEIEAASGNHKIVCDNGTLIANGKLIWVAQDKKGVFYIFEGIKSIGKYALLNCSSLEYIVIPSSVVSIEEGAFSECSSLTSVRMEISGNGGVTNIGVRAFNGCSALISIDIPYSVTSIGDGVFNGCSSLISVNVYGSSKYTSFYGGLLEDNELIWASQNIEEFLIPSSVTSIKDGVFDECDKLKFIISEKDILNDGKINLTQKKTNDYCTFYFLGNHSSDILNRLTDNYLKSRYLIGAYKERYESVEYEQREEFDILTNPTHLINILKGKYSEMAAYNDSLSKAYNSILNLVAPDRMDNNLFGVVLKEAIQEIGRANNYNCPYAEKDGIIVDASQFSSNGKDKDGSSYEGLIANDDDNTYFKSSSVDNLSKKYPYLQVDLRDTYENVVLKYSSSWHGYAPKILRIYVTNTPNDESSWVDFGKRTCTYDFANDHTGILSLDFSIPYQYIRLVVEKTFSKSDNPDFCWGELHVYPKYSAYRLSALTVEERTALYNAVNAAKKEFYGEIATKDTYLSLKELLDKLNSKTADLHYMDYSTSSYLTLFSDKSLTVPDGVEAAIVVKGGNDIRNDYRYSAGSVIPAGTGVLLKGGKGNSFYLSEGETTEAAPAENLLHGTLSDETTDVEGDNLYYKLAYDAETGTKIGFYWGAQGGAPFVNKAGKAFLAVPSAASQSLMGISIFDLDKGMTTGIANTTADSKEMKIYDLNGRRVEATSLNGLQRGIYVVNGKKIYVK